MKMVKLAGVTRSKEKCFVSPSMLKYFWFASEPYKASFENLSNQA